MFFQEAHASSDTISIQSQEAAPVVAELSQSGWMSMIPMVLIFAVFYFLLIRPQEKRRRQKETLVSGVKKGEEVLTSSRIFGIVTKINDSDNTVDLEIAKDTQIKVLKSAIADITSRAKEENNKKIKNKKDKGT